MASHAMQNSDTDRAVTPSCQSAGLGSGARNLNARSAAIRQSRQARSGVRSVESFALVEGPNGAGLVVHDLRIGTPMGAWLESDAIVVAGQWGLVRIKIGRQVCQKHWPTVSHSSHASKNPMHSKGSSTIDLLEIVQFPGSDDSVQAPGERRLWRLPLLQAATLALGRVGSGLI